MLNFKKVFLAAAVASLGLVGSANAQYIYGAGGTYAFAGAGATGNASFAAQALAALRSEGITEQLPATTVAGITGTANATTASFYVTTSAPITNVILTGSTTNQTDAIAVFAGWGALPTTTVNGVLINSTTLQFTLTGIGIGAAPGTITVANIRVNVSALSAGTAVTSVPSGAPAGNIAFTTAATALTEGITQASLAKVKLTGYNNLAVCSIGKADVNAVATAVVAGAYAGAFLTDTAESNRETVASVGCTTCSLPQAIPLAAGLTNPAAPSATTSIGTRIAVSFSNLAAGVNYYLPAVVTNAGTTYTLVATAGTGSGAPGVTTVALGGTGNAGNTNNPGTTGTSTGVAVTGLVLQSVTNGSLTAYYAVTVTNGAGAVDTSAAFGYLITTAAPYSTITLYEVAPTPTSIVPTTTAPAVTISLAGSAAPLYGQYAAGAQSTVTVSATANSTANAIPAGGAGTGSANTSATGLINSCNTTLLFPYVVTVGNYNTGIEITNAGYIGTVPGLTVSASATGTCSLSFWGSASVDGASINGATGAAAFTAGPYTVPAGTIYATTLSSVLPTGQTSFAGYAVATCNFQGGHGYAQISTTDFGGIATTYLAPILAGVNPTNSTYAANNPQF